MRYCLFLLFLLTGCGGGSNNTELPPPIIDSSPPVEPEPPNEPEPPVEPEPPLDPEPPPPPPLTQQERWLNSVNTFRSQEQFCSGQNTTFAAAPPVKWNGNLELAAITHSVDMAENDFLDHTGSDSSHFSTRAFQAGYTGSALFEVIAAGSNTFNGTLNQWIGSRTGHCGFLMRQEVTEIGAGFAFDRTSTYGYYWTLIGGIR